MILWRREVEGAERMSQGLKPLLRLGRLCRD
jgi:hypothetical protein